MKKIFSTIGLLTVMALPSVAAEKYGVVNVDYVMSKYPAALQANDAIRRQETEVQKFLLDARKDLEKTPESQRKAKEEKYNKELQTKAMALRQQEEKKGQELFNKFDAAVKAVARENGYTLIVPAALYGASDISDLVIKKLNAK
ncbi:MAG: OmpH family outer membrane protein [bacterium]|nr:OmpH family outer membrane protein [bacterium]